MITKITGFGILVLASLLLAACFGSPSSIPEDRFYTLSVATADKFTGKYKRININKVYAYGIYNERALLYANADFPLEIKRYHYHHWAMPPTQLIQHALKTYLSESHISQNVVQQSINSDADLRITGKLLGFERIIQTTSQSVHVEIEFEVYRENGRYQSFHYEQNVAAKSNTMHGAVQAYGVALSRIFKDFTTDLSE